MSLEIKTILLVFGIALLVVILTQKAIKKVKKERIEHPELQKKPQIVEKPQLTEIQFQKTWKSLSYLLLLAAAGSVYMVYTAVKSGITSGLFIFWIDAGFSFAAAVSAMLIFIKRSKSMVFLYFGFTIVPIMMFMSIKGYKLNALVHLFPLVLLYFVLKPIWNNMKI